MVCNEMLVWQRQSWCDTDHTGHTAFSTHGDNSRHCFTCRGDSPARCRSHVFANWSTLTLHSCGADRCVDLESESRHLIRQDLDSGTVWIMPDDTQKTWAGIKDTNDSWGWCKAFTFALYQELSHCFWSRIAFCCKWVYPQQYNALRKRPGLT